MPLGRFADLCRMPGMPTPPTLRDWIGMRDDFPIARRRGSSREWLYDLNEAADYVRKHYRDRRGGSSPRHPASLPFQPPFRFEDGA